MKQLIRTYGLVALGSVIYALAYDLFFDVNQIAMGGVTGLAQILNALFPQLPVGTLTLAMNIPLFLIGWKLLGSHMLASSLFAVAISSVAIDAINAFFAFRPMDMMLATVCGGALLGLGLGIVFAQGATTGGTDVVAKLLKLKFGWLPLGQLVLAADMVVLVLAALVFGRLEAALYGLVALYVSTLVMDTVLYGLDTAKVAYIISDAWREIADSLMGQQERGVTILQGTGAYTGQGKQVLLVAFKQREIVQIRRQVHDADPHAFMIVCNAHDVWGEGFAAYNKEDI